MSTEILNTQPDREPRTLGRRAFIIGTATAVSAAAFWGLRRSTIAAARPMTADEGPKEVTIVRFSADGKRAGTVTIPRVIKTDEEWKRQLSQASYWVTRKADTERPFTGELLNEHDRGIFRCICCDLALFSSETKFDSGTGWPSSVSYTHLDVYKRQPQQFAR